MNFTVTRDPEEFERHVWPLLEARLDCNVLATVLLAVLDGHYDGVEKCFAYRRDRAGQTVTAAMRTAPFPMLCTALGPGEAEALLDAWTPVDPAPPGINGLPETARAIAQVWRRRTGDRAVLIRSMAMHTVIEPTDPPHIPAGALRAARADELELLVDWWLAFGREADALTNPAHARGQVQARLREGGAYLWDRDGDPVSLVAISPPVAGIPRIGPVYTPPEHRRRGYAGMAVAEVTRIARAAGAPQVTLFTDLANPTANKIYAEVGYRRFGDWEEYAFRPGSPHPASDPPGAD